MITKKKQQQEENELKLAIAKGKMKQEFDCLHKMGEACEVAKLLGIPVSFTTKKTPTGLQILMKKPGKEGGEEIKELSVSEFMRKYNKLKRIQNSVKNIQILPSKQKLAQSSSGAIAPSFSSEKKV